MKDIRRELRNNMTEGEKALWRMIRGEQLGVKFRRQHSVGNYVIDFYCAQLRLAIEVDGNTHEAEGAAIRDRIRQRTLEDLNITFVRLTDYQVFSDATTVLRLIREAIDRLSAPAESPSPSNEGEVPEGRRGCHDR